MLKEEVPGDVSSPTPRREEGEEEREGRKEYKGGGGVHLTAFSLSSQTWNVYSVWQWWLWRVLIGDVHFFSRLVVACILVCRIGRFAMFLSFFLLSCPSFSFYTARCISFFLFFLFLIGVSNLLCCFSFWYFSSTASRPVGITGVFLHLFSVATRFLIYNTKARFGVMSCNNFFTITKRWIIMINVDGSWWFFEVTFHVFSSGQTSYFGREMCLCFETDKR